MRLRFAVLFLFLISGCGGGGSSGPSRPLFTKSGVGNQVFDMPDDVERVHIVGTYTDCCSNFIVKVGGELIVNDLIGREFPSTVSDGTYAVKGGVTEITDSSGVVWSFTEIR